MIHSLPDLKSGRDSYIDSRRYRNIQLEPTTNSDTLYRGNAHHIYKSVYEMRAKNILL